MINTGVFGVSTATTVTVLLLFIWFGKSIGTVVIDQSCINIVVKSTSDL